MPRYIDADALLVSAYHLPYSYNGAAWLQVINDAPTADVVPAVRCRDCKYWANGLTEERPCNKTGAYPMRSEDYCSYGEKMEGGT